MNGRQLALDGAPGSEGFDDVTMHEPKTFLPFSDGRLPHVAPGLVKEAI